MDSNDKEKLRREFESKSQEEQLKILYCVLLKQIEPLYKEYKDRINKNNIQEFWYYYLTFALVASERVANRDTVGLKEIFKFDQALYHAFESNLVLDPEFCSVNLDLATIIAFFYAIEPHLAFNLAIRCNLNDLHSCMQQDLTLESFKDIPFPKEFEIFKEPLTNFSLEYREKLREALEEMSSSFIKERRIDLLTQYLKDSFTGMTRKRNFARVILLGRGGSGKTSLIYRLIEPKDGPLLEFDSTPRIEIKTIKEDSIEIDFWDFGGQVIMHQMHNLFLNSKALYIVTVNARADEQPDIYLEQLNQQLDSIDKVDILIVYTFVDDKNDREYYKNSSRNRLSRLHKDRFNLNFFALSNKDIDNDFQKFKDVLYKKAKQIANMAVDKRLQTLYKEAKSPIISGKEILDNLKKKNIKEPLGLMIDMLKVYGLLFPVKKEQDSNDKDAKYIWQKHWLTYGVYFIINSKEIKQNGGFLTKSDFLKILRGKKESLKNKELIEYKEDKDIEVLYEVIKSYKIALINNKRLDELIFPNALRLDEPDELDRYKFKLGEDSGSEIKILFETLPNDFFFNLLTIAEKHILEPKLLYRSGAILFDFLDREIYAKVEVKQNSLTIQVSGDNRRRKFLRDFLIYYILMLIEKRYSNLKEVRFLQKVKIQDKEQLIDLNMLERVDSDEFMLEYKRFVKQEYGMSINFNGNVGEIGSIIETNNGIISRGDGSRNTINQNTINKLLPQLEELKEELKKHQKETLAKELEELIKEPKKDKSWKEKIKSFLSYTNSILKDSRGIIEIIDSINKSTY